MIDTCLAFEFLLGIQCCYGVLSLNKQLPLRFTNRGLGPTRWLKDCLTSRTKFKIKQRNRRILFTFIVWRKLRLIQLNYTNLKIKRYLNARQSKTLISSRWRRGLARFKIASELLKQPPRPTWLTHKKHWQRGLHRPSTERSSLSLLIEL